MGGDSDPLTFPGSGVGHVRQNRFFLEVKLDHDIRRLAKTGWGVARAFDWLDPDTLRYSLQYRGEGEGIYDYGPDEFHHQYTKTLAVVNDVPNIPALGLSSKVPPEFARQRVDRLRRIARQRHRFFLGYIDFEKGPVFLRIGRQILAWGETDVFRCSTTSTRSTIRSAGFFIALDERGCRSTWRAAAITSRRSVRCTTRFSRASSPSATRSRRSPASRRARRGSPARLGHPLPNLETTPTFRGRRSARRRSLRLQRDGRDVHARALLHVPGRAGRTLPHSRPGPAARESTPSNTPRFGSEIQAIQHFPRVQITARRRRSRSPAGTPSSAPRRRTSAASP
jgi:hypothetical protein